jgi:hypothetical protein
MIYPGLPQDQQVLAAIGKIALRHGQLDYALKLGVKSLAGISIAEAIDATARQTSHELRERVRRLARKRFGEGDVLVRLDAILERSRRATETRNQLLHSLWAHELDGEPVIRRQGYEFQRIPTVTELEAVADDLAQIANDFTVARLDDFLRDALARPEGAGRTRC